MSTKTCIHCEGTRVASVYGGGQTAYETTIQYQDRTITGPAPIGLGIGGGCLSFDWCLDCGRIQFKQFPVDDEVLKAAFPDDADKQPESYMVEVKDRRYGAVFVEDDFNQWEAWIPWSAILKRSEIRPNSVVGTHGLLIVPQDTDQDMDIEMIPWDPGR